MGNTVIFSKKKFTLIFVVLTLFAMADLCQPRFGFAIANAQTVCNDPSGFIKTDGPITLGDVLVLNPDCQHVQDGGKGGNPAIFYVTAFGAKCDGVTNDAVAITAAINAAGPVGGTVLFPIGTCISNSAIAISASYSSIVLQGQSKIASTVSFPNGSGFSFTTNNGALFANNFRLICATSGNCLTLGQTGPNTAPQLSVIKDMQFFGGGKPLVILNVGDTRVLHNDFFNCTTTCLEVSAPINPDGGDNWISHNFFLNSGGFAGTASGIHYITGGGWKIISNKINGFIDDIFINPNMTTGQGMSDIQIQDNSLEGYTTAGILVQNQGTLGNISNMLITGNEGGGASGSFFLEIQNDGAGWLANASITGNIVQGVNQAGGFFIDGLDRFVLSGNVLTDTNTCTTGITITAKSSRGMVVGNTIVNCTTQISNAGSVVTVPTGVNGP